MRVLRSLGALAAASLIGGCAHLTLPGGVRCPSHGGPQWREYRSKHFLVDTDLEPQAGAALARQLEMLQARLVVALTGQAQEVPGYVRVVVPANGRAFWEVAPPPLAGYFTIGAFWEPTIVVHPAALREQPEVIAHELAHHLARRWFPRQPPWFREGFAEFVQTVAVEQPAQVRGAAGLLPRNIAAERGWVLRSVQPIPARALLALAPGDDMSFEGYVWSWVLYHWLWNQRPAQLAGYLQRLQRAEDPATAWKAAFPDLDPDDPKAMKALDAALDEHRRRGELVYYRVEGQWDSRVTDAPLAPGEIHLLLLRFGASIDSGAMLRTVLEDDPLNPRALSLRASAAGRRAPADLRAAAAAHPQDWRAWVLLGDAIEQEGDWREREAAYRKAVALEPRSALAQTRLAAFLAKAGRPQEALPSAEVAIELAPGIPDVLDAVAGIASDLGRCDEALALLGRAVDVRPGKQGEPFRRHLRETEDRCRKATAAEPRPADRGAARGASQ